VPKYVSVSLDRDLLETIFGCAKNVYPRETIFLLRGQRKKDAIVVTDLVVPPLARYGRGFSNIPLFMLPMDFSLVGTVHSHPSGNISPSNADLNHFFGIILMIVGSPFISENDIAVYARSGDRLTVHVTESQS
jgi:proteasome lid subunit RPN8/RPN11